MIMLQKLDSLLSEYDKGLLSRRQLLAAMAAVAVSPAISSPAGFEAKSFNHVTLAVSDVQRSQAFYERVLGVGVVSTQKNGINLGLGDSFLGLYKIDDTPRIHHFCVGLDQYDVNEAADKLRELGIDPIVRQDKPEVYFQDPDGITVQLENKRYRG
jgi:catechol 2,3-dioxygenase-like lactoylglutathione lyase family enzyme